MALKTDIIQKIDSEMMRSDPLEVFRPGDTVKVHYLIREGDKERTQVFQGVVIREHRGTSGRTFTVRKVSYGIGVERTFPYHSPRLQKVEVQKRGRVRRSRLFYLRELRGKAARIRER